MGGSRPVPTHLTPPRPRSAESAHDADGPTVIVAVATSANLDAADAAWIDAQTRAAAGVLGLTGEIGVRVVGDAEMADLHLRYCGVAGTTDVLTFDLIDSAHAEGMAEGDGRPVEVDIVVCLDEAARQAAARFLAVRHELLLYVVHGLLHCLGCDDGDDAAFARMHAREDALMAALGLPPAFHAAAGEGARA
ncbi:hypothetical protein BH11PLA1_BH11PLA1_19950 [soil metagenome]